MASSILDHRGRAMASQKIATPLPTPYDSAGHGRRVRGMLAPATGPNQSAIGSAQTLRNRSRQQIRNNGYAKSAVNKLVSNIVGTGIKPRSMADNKTFQGKAQALWAQSATEMDPEGLLDVYGQQTQAVSTWQQAGECFIRMRPRRTTDGLAVPMQLQVMEPEMCPINYTDTRNGNTVRNGIEYNAIGQRVAYYFYQSHPGDIDVLNTDPMRLSRVPAAEVIHLFDPCRPGQSRGIPQLASVLLKFNDIDKFDDATLLRQQIANLFTAFVTNNSGEAPPVPNSLGDSEPQADGAIEDLGLEPGIIQELLEGQNIEFSKPPDAGSNYGDFMRWQLLDACAGGEVPYEVLTGDFSKINDRTARVLLNEFRRRVQQMQSNIVIHQFCRRVWADWWMPRAILSGALTAQGYANNPGKYTAAKHIPQAWEYIHPEQDVNAYRMARRNGFKTRQQIISETTGEDIDDVDAQIAAENEKADDLGLVYDTDARYTDGSGKSTADNTDEQDDANE